MNDWGKSVLDQYDMEFDSIKRGKGILICSSGGKEYCLMPFKGSEKRLFEEAQLLDYLYGKGHLVDCMIKTADGDYIARNEYQDPFTLRLWHPGDECVSTEPDKLLRGAKKLAFLHIDMKSVPQFNPPTEPVKESSAPTGSLADSLPADNEAAASNERAHNSEVTRHIESCQDVFLRRTRELKKIRTFVKQRKSKSTFEEQILKSFPAHIYQAEQAMACLSNCGYTVLLTEAVKNRTFIHGSFNYHYIYLQKDTESVVNFSKYAMQVQILDLYEFLRKTMEKNDWDISLGEEIIDAYTKINTISDNELKVLLACLTFPDKYWKQLNTYYNSNKVWIPLRSQEKLSLALAQSELREKFVSHISGL